MKKSCCRNIINKKSIEEKKVDEIFLIAVFFFPSGRGESKCVGSVHYVSGTGVREFDFLDEVFGQWMLNLC